MFYALHVPDLLFIGIVFLSIVFCAFYFVLYNYSFYSCCPIRICMYVWYMLL